jgi:tetraacyldisaccharide 4'-kinase
MIRILLYPFAILYDLVTSIRNELYNRGSKPSVKFDVPVIGIGNLTVGGTGKTPMVEYLIRLLDPPYQVVTLSRGYGRKTKGFLVADETQNASTMGDEPFQLYKKFGSKVKVVVAEERAMAIPLIIDQFENTDVILMDDAFQHRRVRPSFQVLLTDYNRPFYKDFLLPAGRLRESRKGAARADAIVVTKCPAAVTDDHLMDIEQHIRRYSNVPVFFSAIRYGVPISFSAGTVAPGGEILLVSGIASDEDFVRYLDEHYHVVGKMRFPDHHIYTRTDIEKIHAAARERQASIICTEKDFVKLKAFEKEFGDLGLFYLPIKPEFIKNGKEFDEMVMSVVGQRENAMRTPETSRRNDSLGES